MTGPSTFQFLNVERACSFPSSWADRTARLLWLYNLHYFDDLNAVGAAARLPWHMAMIERWITDNPPHSAPGWEPYPTSLRIANWVKWSWRGEIMPAEMVESLVLQMRSLERRLEHHLRGNHVIANAKALILGGCRFGGREGDRWLEDGLALLTAELAHQVLDDGGHYERSPMYHSVVLEDVLDVLNGLRVSGLDQRAEAEILRARASEMLRWLIVMRHPDGEIPFFNDAALGTAGSPGQLLDYAQKLGIQVPDEAPLSLSLFGDTGFARMERGPAVLLANVGGVGPDEQPGHAHADTLSFEFSLRGSRLLVNSGTSTYEEGAERARQRGTPAHNTLTVAGRDSSEVWGSFRVAHRAEARILGARADTELATIKAEHDGYRRQGIDVVHRRRITLTETFLEIKDEISGSGHHPVEVRFHLAPDVRAHPSDGGVSLVSATSGEPIATLRANGLCPSIEPSTYHPEFGVTKPTVCIVTRQTLAIPGILTHLIQWS